MMNSLSKVIVSKRHLNLDNDPKDAISSSRSTKPKDKRISLGGLTAGLKQRGDDDLSRQSDTFAKTWGPAFHSTQMSTTKCSVKTMDETIKSQILNSVHSKLAASRNGLSKYLSNTNNNNAQRQSSPSATQCQSPKGQQMVSEYKGGLQIGLRKASLQQIQTKQTAKKSKVEMISHKRVITQTSSAASQNPPFSMKNMILAQATSNYNTAASAAGRSTLESAIYSALQQHPGTTKSQGPNRFQFRKSIDQSNNKNDFISLIQRHPHVSQTTPSHQSGGVQRISHGGYTTEKIGGLSRNSYKYGSSQKSVPHYQCETGGSANHKISPLLSQNSLTSQKQFPEQPTITHRPMSNLTALNQTAAPSNLFNLVRPSFDRSAIINRSEKFEKRMQTTNPQSKKQMESSSSSEENFSDLSNEEQGAFTSSQIDTLATVSLVESKTGIKLPISHIPVCKLLPGGITYSNEESKDCASQKTTERNHKPFGRPGQTNQPLIMHNILAQTCSPKKLKQRIDQMKITKSTLLEGSSVNEISSAPLNYISRSRSQSPQSDVEAEYFQAGSQQSGKTRTNKLVEKAVRGQETFNNFLPLLEGYCKKGDILSLQNFIASEKSLVPKIQENLKFLLYKAIEFNHPALLKYLLNTFQQTKSENFNLLHIACRQSQKQNIQLFKQILTYDSQAKLNQQDTYGNTPVHLCAQNGRVEVLKYFFKDHLPDITIMNSEGKTPMHCRITSIETIMVFAAYITRLQDLKHPSLKHITRLLNSDEDLKPLWNQVKESNEQAKRMTGRRQKENDGLRVNRQKSQERAKADVGFSAKRVSTGGFSYKPCETEPSLSSRFRLQTQDSRKCDKVNINTDEDEDNFDSDDLQEIDAPQLMEDDKSQTLQFCEQIEEVSEDSLRQSLIGAVDKIGAHSFEPISLIGKGSFGEVYLVRKRDSCPEQLFAMKVLQKEKILGQNLVKYAVTERNVLSITKHPFIVGLNFAFQTRDKLFLILDFCPGGDLGKVIGREKRLSEERARIYLSEILLALENLHERDIIFRDLKPDNVVLDAEGHALLTDFGLSKVGVLDNLGAKSFCGSIAYLAPEMLKRTGHGKSVDWYLLGVLFYEMVVGIPPYFTNNREKIFQNIQRGPLLMPTQLSKPAQDLIVKLLNKNPLKRLGAGIRDAEEIKEHQFFEGVEWDKVYKREMKPPKPEIRRIKPLHPSEMISYAQILTKHEKMKGKIQDQINRLIEDDNNLPGWSFVTPGVIETAATQ